MINNIESISLIEALKISIEKIKSSFNNKQSVIYNSEEGDCLSMDLNILADPKYVTVVEPHYHEYTEICMCINGKLALQFGNHIQDVLEGDIEIILPGVLHNEASIKNNKYLALWMAFDVFKTTLHVSGKNINNSIYIVDGCTLKSDCEFDNILKCIRMEFHNQSEYNMDIIKAYLIEFISLQLGYYDQYHFSKSFKSKTGYSPAQFRKLLIETHEID